MGIIARQSFKGAIAQYIGIILGYINLVILFPMCTTLVENGVVRFVLEMGALLATFAQFGVPNSLPRFFTRFKLKKNGIEYLNSLVLFLVLLGVISSFLFMFFMEPFIIKSFKYEPQVIKKYYWFIYIVSVLFVLFNVLDQYSVVNLRLTVPKLLREVGVKLSIMILLILMYFNIIVFDQLLYGIIIIYIIFIGILYLYINKLKPFKISYSIQLFNDDITKQYFKFIGFMILAGLGANAVTKIDFYMVSNLIDFSSLAVYSTAMYIAVLIEIPLRLIIQISSPIIAEHLLNKKYDRIKEIYIKSSINQLIFGSTLFLFLLYNINNIVELMPSGKDFSDIRILVLYLGIGKLVSLVFGTSSAIIFNSKYYGTGLVFVLFLAAFTIGSNYYFINKMGLLGVGIATAITISLYYIMLAGFVYFKFNIHPLTKNTFIVFLLLMLNIVVFKILPLPNNIYINIVVVSLLSASNLLLCVYLNLSKDINENIKNLWAKVKP